MFEDYPVFSPDGKKIAFISDRGNNLDIYVMDADGQNLTNLSNNGASDFMPDWGVAVQNGPRCTITGTEANDALVGTSGNDVICALGGSDTIDGRGGDDTLFGDAGNDTATGGAGKDTLLGGEGSDKLDALDGVSSNDSVEGGAGFDVCRADRGDAKTGCEIAG